MINAGTEAKWSCPSCTYLNYPSGSKCTICRSARPSTSQRIEDVACSTTTVSSDNEDAKNEQEDRWSCSSCTYNNWSKTQRCVQCGNAQPHSDTPGHLTTTPPVESTSDAASSSNLVLLDSAMLSKSLQKWACSSCTYENWPKTSKCVMCHMKRSITKETATSPLNSGSSSPRSTVVRDKKRVLDEDSDHSEATGRKSPKNTVSSSVESLSASASKNLETLEGYEKRLRSEPSRIMDVLWIRALRCLLFHTPTDAVDTFLSAGGEPSRQLTSFEADMLHRHRESMISAVGGAAATLHFEAGQTLLVLALGAQRSSLVPALLAKPRVREPGVWRGKNVPSHASPETAAAIRRAVALSLRQRKGDFPCYHMTELTTFALPSSIYELSPSMQQRLFDEVLDRAVQKELEEELTVINWSLEVTDRLSSRLYALWNRTAGDCLLDSVLQATWGIFDSENSLRQALANSLADAAQAFYPRWRSYESMLAKAMHYTMDEEQYIRDWDYILELAARPGASLEQMHIFALAHIVRRPILVYAVRIVKSYRGEHLDFARFEGVYLPLLWDPTFCTRSPICLGYTRGHFVALAPIEPAGFRKAGRAERNIRHAHLPLQDAGGKFLPVHFVLESELGHEQQLLCQWLDITLTPAGLWCAKMKLHTQPALVEQMMDDWLDVYRASEKGDV